MTTHDDPILVAELGAAVGLRGEIRIKLYTETADSLMALSPLFDKAGETYTLRSIRAHKNASVVTIDGITSRTDAERLTRRKLYAHREQLSQDMADDEFYMVDLVGCEVVDESDQWLGEIIHVHNYGAGDVIEFGRGDEPTELVSFTAENFPSVDLLNRRVEVSMPPIVTDEADGGPETEAE